MISVIIPTYNRAHTIKRAIDSVLKQTYKNFEIIVIDDGSSDNTEEILKDYIDSKKIIYEKIENKGVSHARNVGVLKAQGEWFSFLDSDDEWLKNKLEKQIEFIKNNPHIKIVHGEEIWIRLGKRVNQKKIHQKFGGFIFKKCLPLCLISPSAVMIKRELYEEMGGFDESFIVCEDYDLWLKITSLYEVGFISDPIIIKHGGHEDQLSHKYFAMDLWRVKSMIALLKRRSLSEDDYLALKGEVMRKADILMKGYEKHGNNEALKEVQNLICELEVK